MAERVALVTGASRGIGKATAVALAEAGLDVAITARTVHEGEGVDDSDSAGRPVPGSLETTATLIEEKGRRALPVAMDLLDRASLIAAIEHVLDEWGNIDVLVNNAVHTGPGSMARFDDTTIDVVETKLQANVVSQLVLIKAVLPHMLERGDGTIINVTSAVAYQDPTAPPGEGGWGSAYAMSKGAFHRIAPSLSVEYPMLRFFNVQPGYVDTERMEVNAKTLGIEAWSESGIAGRGVLLDVARHADIPGDTSFVVTTDHLDETAKAQGVKLQMGDVLCVRVGWLGWYLGLDAAGRKAVSDGSRDYTFANFHTPGLAPGPAVAEYLWDHGVAAIAVDNPGVEPFGAGGIGEPGDSVHTRVLALLGIPLGEFFDFEALAEDCAADGVYEFLFTSKPLGILGGLGSPPNAIAIK